MEAPVTARAAVLQVLDEGPGSLPHARKDPMTETLRPFRAQLDERKPPSRAFNGTPLSVLREAYQHAHDTRQANADQPETIRDYWPTCVEMVLVDHDLLTFAECKLIA